MHIYLGSAPDNNGRGGWDLFFFKRGYKLVVLCQHIYVKYHKCFFNETDDFDSRPVRTNQIWQKV